VSDSRGYNWDFYISVGLSVLAGILVIAGLRKIPMRKPEVKAETPALIRSAATARPAVRYGPVIVQCVIAALFFMGIGVNSFLPLLATQIVGVDASQVGILFTVGGLVSMFLFIPAGRLADRMDKKVLIIIGMLLSGLSMAGFAFFREYWLLIAMSIMGNIGFTLFTPAAVALLSNNVPGYWQGTAMGIYGAAEDMGIILGSAVGGFVWTAGGPVANYMMGFGAGVLGAIICMVFIKGKTAAPALKPGR
jgi:predicted MFS family arabinose efflux permease